MSDRWPHTGAVLVGGQNRRMGTEKANLPLPSGLTMLESIISVLRQVCTRVVVVGGTHATVRSIPDRRAGQGPLGGIESLLASGIDNEFLVAPTDMPYLDPALLDRLLQPTNAAATVFSFEGQKRTQSLPLRISIDALAFINASLDSGRRELHRLLEDLTVNRVLIGREVAQTALVNINEPSEYQSLWDSPGGDRS